MAFGDEDVAIGRESRCRSGGRTHPVPVPPWPGLPSVSRTLPSGENLKTCIAVAVLGVAVDRPDVAVRIGLHRVREGEYSGAEILDHFSVGGQFPDRRPLRRRGGPSPRCGPCRRHRRCWSAPNAAASAPSRWPACRDWGHRSRTDSLPVRSPPPRRRSSRTVLLQFLFDPNACVPPQRNWQPCTSYWTSYIRGRGFTAHMARARIGLLGPIWLCPRRGFLAARVYWVR